MRFSCPYTSEQNDKAERTIRTVNNIIRTLLFQASLPPKYWVEALNMAVHVLNLLPTTTLSLRAPFEVLFGFSQTYTRLRVFGCLCYPNISSTTQHKMAPHLTACVYHDHLPFFSFHSAPDTSEYNDFLEPDSIFGLPDASRVSDRNSDSNKLSMLSQTLYASRLLPNSPFKLPFKLVVSHGASSSSNTQSNLVRTHFMTTRSQTGSLKAVQRLSLSACTMESPLPRSTAQAICDSNWKAAMDFEMSALLSNSTWDLVPPHSHVNIVGCRWLYQHKFDSFGNLERY
ncbi:ribonuclease H-like domain-containing protein [Tanacetum coccineum]